ncbi:MAG: beta-N-acetylhexosaminidase [Glaciecola sp.]|jgi:beta-N-acetylhexosaminidase
MHPLMIDVAGFELSAEEKEIVAHPLVGGIILFARNYHDPQQLIHLTQSLRAACPHPLLIAVDQEGGRVQRFRDGFTTLPTMRSLRQHQQPQELAAACGTVIATECLLHGIDITFAPVLDLDGISEVIQCRSFGATPEDIVTLAGAFCRALLALQMGPVGKHFPGHGNVMADSHIALPIDNRPLTDIVSLDMSIFKTLIAQQLLTGIMPAHVIYSLCDPQPAGFSTFWLQQQLRTLCAFQGVIFSDDLSMHAATQAGSMTERVQAALTAGCDMALICNTPDAAVSVLDELDYSQPTLSLYSNKAQMLCGNRYLYQSELQTQRYVKAQSLVQTWTSSMEQA